METFDLTLESDRLALAARVFKYPSEPHRRKHGPRGYKDYESYRDWLRDEFSYRCVFGLAREAWLQTSLHIDHLTPQSDHPDLRCEYDNLILLEGRLNLVKGKKELDDPCKVALGQCLYVYFEGDRMGEIEAPNNNRVGERIIAVLRLDSEDATRMRRDWLGILYSVARTDEALFRKLIGYPANLPKLCDARVQKNTRPQGLEQSAHHLRATGKLPEWY